MVCTNHCCPLCKHLFVGKVWFVQTKISLGAKVMSISIFSNKHYCKDFKTEKKIHKWGWWKNVHKLGILLSFVCIALLHGLALCLNQASAYKEEQTFKFYVLKGADRSLGLNSFLLEKMERLINMN